MKIPTKAQRIVYSILEANVLANRRRKLREDYSGFSSEELNSNQPLPKNRSCVYKTLHEPWALLFARRLRRKHGINVWIDGTVATGWRVLVQGSDYERARRMAASL